MIWLYVIILMLCRSLSVFVSYIDDCDEVFNYWEPLHFLLYGTGLQTWEYSPEFGLRSYSYLIPYASVGSLGKLLFDSNSKMEIFLFLRIFQSLLTAASEASLLSSVHRHFGSDTSKLFFWFSFLNCGIFLCSSSLLPSTSCLQLMNLSLAYWIDDRKQMAMFSAIIGVIWPCWPFVFVSFIPLVIDCCLAPILHSFSINFQYKLIGQCISFTVLLCSLIIAIDSQFFMSDIKSPHPQLVISSSTFPALNILSYNVLNSSGDVLYGIDSWTYYVKSLLLAANISLPLAGISVIVAWVSWYKVKQSPQLEKWRVMSLIPLFWVSLLLSRPHKEARFMYPIYSLFPLLCSIVLSFLTKIPRVFIVIILLIQMTLTGSRIESTRQHYPGYQLTHDLQHSGNLCLSDFSWYHYPSSFHFDYSTISFISSTTSSSLLPQTFTSLDQSELLHNMSLLNWYQKVKSVTSMAPKLKFNNLNEVELDRYVMNWKEECETIVLLESESDEFVNQVKRWGSFVNGNNVMDDGKSARNIFRSFFVPVLSEREVVYTKYSVYRKKA